MPLGRVDGIIIPMSIVTVPTIRANALVGALVRKGKVPLIKL